MQFSFFDIQKSRLHKGRQTLPRFRSTRKQIPLEAETGPLALIRGKEVLVLTDNQNFDRTAQKLGYKMSWLKLGLLLDNVSERAHRHAILAHRPDDNRRIEYLAKRGWIPHATFVRTVHTRHGLKHKGNADMSMTFWGGHLVSRSQAGVILIGSGDGDLVQELAIGIRSLPTPRTIVTIGFESSTASRLYTHNSDLIDGNIFIGLDCLRPIREPKLAASAAA